MEIPFDGIITLLLFLIGLPVFVWQFKDADVREVVLKHSILRWGIPVLVLVSVAVSGLALWLWFRIELTEVKNQQYWVSVFGVLFLLTIVYAILIYFFSDRQYLIKSLKRHVETRIRKGKPVEKVMDDLIGLGKISQAGAQRTEVLVALLDVTTEICYSSKHWSLLERLIDETVIMLISSPQREDLENFRVAIDLLTNVANAEDIEEDKYCQHAVRALSMLGQRILVDFRQSDRTDALLLEIIALLGLSPFTRLNLVTDVSQALFELGKTAVEEKQPFIADTALDKLISLAEGIRPVRKELQADMLGLTAIFWTGSRSMREHLRAGKKMERVQDVVSPGLGAAAKNARKHFLGKAEFELADKLAIFIKQVGPRKAIRRANGISSGT